jgi:collagenase-like PrtC family protease
MKNENPPHFDIGYRQSDSNFKFLTMVENFHSSIDSVYFSWLNTPSARAALRDKNGWNEWGVQEELEKDLKAIKQLKIKLNLLFNASCYGELSISRYLSRYVLSVIDRLESIGAKPEIVTTCSPFIADIIKKNHKDIKTRASINMKIGSIQGMEYLADFFDEYNMQREYNRDISHIKDLKKWADVKGKNLVMLANSGCLYDCSAQSFHDNMVSHETEIGKIENVPGLELTNCRRLMRSSDNWKYFLQATWIRPDDLHHYTEYFPVVKLATRMHQNPWLVLQAYTTGFHPGALTDLLEPCFSGELGGTMIANQAFPEDWHEKTTSCGRKCNECRYCEEVLKKTLTDGASFFVR